MSSAEVPSTFEERYTLPAIQSVDDTTEEIRRKQERVRQLCTSRNAILLAQRFVAISRRRIARV